MSNSIIYLILIFHVMLFAGALEAEPSLFENILFHNGVLTSHLPCWKLINMLPKKSRYITHYLPKQLSKCKIL